MSSELRSALSAMGATTPGTLAHLLKPGEDMTDLVGELFLDSVLSESWKSELQVQLSTLVSTATRTTRRTIDVYSGLPNEVITAKWERKLQKEKYEKQEQATTRSTSIMTAPPVKTPTRYRTSFRRGAENIHGGHELESQLRERYLAELVDVLLTIQAPVTQQDLPADRMREMLKMTAAGRRARTLRTRLRAWRAFAKWLAVVHDERWPSSWVRVAEYANVRAGEPCGRSTLRGIFLGVSFVEIAGGFSGEQSISAHILLKATARELEGRLTARAGGAEARKAGRPLVSQLAALELYVMDSSKVLWFRAYAWWKLLQAWATFRFDDHRGLNPASITWSAEGMVCGLHRSKTTGKDKKAAVRPACVSLDAYFLEPQWLTTGLGIWKELAPHERDYFLVAPQSDLRSTIPQELRYSEAAGWTQRLQREVGISQEEGAGLDVITGHYSEHSGRFFLPSAAFAAGVPEEELKLLGGWSVSAARGYLLTAHKRICKIQSYVAKLGRDNWGGEDVFGESEALEILRKEITKQNLPSNQVDHIIARLTIFEEPSKEQHSWSTESLPTEKVIEESAIPESSMPIGIPQELSATVEATSTPCFKRARTDWYEKGRAPQDARGYVVSISGKRGFRRLNLLGSCYRSLGVDYQNYELLGETLLAAEEYDDICGKCWPTSSRQEFKTPVQTAPNLGDEDDKEVETSGEDSSSTN